MHVFGRATAGERQELIQRLPQGADIDRLLEDAGHTEGGRLRANLFIEESRNEDTGCLAFPAPLLPLHHDRIRAEIQSEVSPILNSQSLTNSFLERSELQ